MKFELSTGFYEVERKGDRIHIIGDGEDDCCYDEMYMTEADFCKFVDNLVKFKESLGDSNEFSSRDT